MLASPCAKLGIASMYKLIIAPSAEDDLNEIVDYIAVEIGNPEAADSFLDEVEAAYDTLEVTPLAFPFCDNPVLRSSGYHQVRVKNYIMIYRVEEVESVVRILHFYHGSQDYLVRFINCRDR